MHSDFVFPKNFEQKFVFLLSMNSIWIHCIENANPADAESFFLNNKSKFVMLLKKVTKFQENNVKTNKTYCQEPSV